MKKALSFLLSITFLASVMITPSFAATQKSSEELLKENAISIQKTDINADAFNPQQTDPEIDAAYQRIEDEENYIVSLINGLSEEETTTSNWEYNLQFLKDNYNTIQEKSNSESINMDNVNSYIEAYENVLAMKDAPDEKVPTASGITANATFNPDKAVNYANKYWEYLHYNPAYPNWENAGNGGDCANFVSQCLYAGGFRMEGRPGTYSAAQNYNNWFSKGTALNSKNVSSTWRGADSFRNYWQRHAVGYKKFSSYSKAAWDYGFRGNAVSLLNSNGRAYHTLFIVGYANYDGQTRIGDLTYVAHTDEFGKGSLKDKVTTYQCPFIIYRTYKP